MASVLDVGTLTVSLPPSPAAAGGGESNRPLGIAMPCGLSVSVSGLLIGSTVDTFRVGTGVAGTDSVGRPFPISSADGSVSF